MSVEVVMPQMGESIAEGTITKWLKQVGDTIERDEPLFEISTDKVDAEIPSPSAGVLQQILHQEGETVEVGKVVAFLGAEAGEAVSAPQASDVPETANAVTTSASSSANAATESDNAVVADTASTSAQFATLQTAQPSASANSSDETGGAGSVEIVMPQMGESIAEGTITKWLKQVGDVIERDEPLFEISTDKVDAEIPSPSAGVLQQILHQEGETVEVGKVVAYLGGAAAASATNDAQPQSEKDSAAAMQANALAPEPAPTISAAATTSSATMPVAERRAVAEVAGRSYDYGHQAATGNGKAIGEQTAEELRRTRSSPLVRNIAKEHGIELSRLSGSGMSGRVTRDDIMKFIESGAALTPQQAMAQGAPTMPPVTAPTIAPQPSSAPAQMQAPQPKPLAQDSVEPMSAMRKKIAEHMVMSKRTSAHVSTVYEIDMTNVAKLRDKSKAAFQAQHGTKLSYMPFIFQAVTQAIRRFPIVNTQISGDSVIYKKDINLGMAVALDWGLIVPVIKRADELSIAGLAKNANDLAERARAKQLKPDEVAGGTFTITNPGVFGGLFGTPIINQPQTAILGVGAIVKRPMVKTSPEGDDYIAIRSMAYFALTFDHRIIDGADAERFLSTVKGFLEAGQFTV